MLPPEVLALMIAALIVAVIARNDSKALAWLAIGMAAFTITYAWWAAGLPYHAAVTGVADYLQCLALLLFARQRWEMVLCTVWQASLLVSIMHLLALSPAGAMAAESGMPAAWIAAVASSTAYAVVLEACNWLALVVIGGAAIARQISDERASRPSAPPGLRALMHLVQQERAHPPFHRVP